MKCFFIILLVSFSYAAIPDSVIITGNKSVVVYDWVKQEVKKDSISNIYACLLSQAINETQYFHLANIGCKILGCWGSQNGLITYDIRIDSSFSTVISYLKSLESFYNIAHMPSENKLSSGIFNWNISGLIFSDLEKKYAVCTMFIGGYVTSGDYLENPMSKDSVLKHIQPLISQVLEPDYCSADIKFTATQENLLKIAQFDFVRSITGWFDCSMAVKNIPNKNIMAHPHNKSFAVHKSYTLNGKFQNKGTSHQIIIDTEKGLYKKMLKIR